MGNSTRVWIFLSTISLTFLFLGQFLGGRPGLLIGFVLALSLNCYLYFMGDRRILKMLHVKQLEGQDPWQANEIIQKASLSARIPKPQVYLMDCETPTALSLGKSWDSGKIILSQGLVEKLSFQELQAILTLQVLHIQRLQTLSSGIAGQCADLLFLFAQWLDLFFSKIMFRKNPFSFFQRLALPLGNALIQFNVNPQSFLETDNLTAEIIGSKKILAEVLWKLHSYASSLPLKAPPTIAPLFVINPITDKNSQSYLKSHPSLKKRLVNLTGLYPV